MFKLYIKFSLFIFGIKLNVDFLTFSVLTDSKNTQTEVKNSAPGLRNTPKMELVLTKAIVLRALTTIFEEVYGKEKVQEMEAALKNILQRSDENEAICQVCKSFSLKKKLFFMKSSEIDPILHFLRCP
jgi:hypothetical protein